MINHKFLESGHIHKEVDSMHAAVEFAKKKTNIFVPSQWDTVLQMARRRHPYNVVPLKHTDSGDIFYFKKYQWQNEMQKKTKDGLKVWMRYLKEEPDVCYLKYDIDEEF